MPYYQKIRGDKDKENVKKNPMCKFICEKLNITLKKLTNFKKPKNS
jgi:hypothetical protein